MFFPSSDTQWLKRCVTPILRFVRMAWLGMTTPAVVVFSACPSLPAKMAVAKDILKNSYFADLIDLSQFSEEEKTVNIPGVMQKAKVNIEKAGNCCFYFTLSRGNQWSRVSISLIDSFGLLACLITSNFQWATIKPIVPRHSIAFIAHL